ncbi:MAG: LytTR family DNA-binding domain-containing protein, partial [Roseateles sp.]
PPMLWFRVWVISGLVMTVRILVWRRPPTPAPTVETRVVVAPSLPEAEAAFRQRLSAKRRAARLIAVEAHDHYLRVHTDAGVELLTMRFSDALAELSGAHGFQTHRSWWVAGEAIEAAQWRRGAGELRLAGDLIAPVSRRHAPTLRAAGWL